MGAACKKRNRWTSLYQTLGLIFIFSTPVTDELLGVPENQLLEKEQEISAWISSHLKTASFIGHDGTVLASGHLEGDPSLPPLVFAVGLGETHLHLHEVLFDLGSDPTFRQADPLPARFIAHSTGGLVTIRLLARRPEVAANALLITPLLGMNSTWTQQWQRKQAR